MTGRTRVAKSNPAVDAAQYRLAQAVLHGRVRTKTSMTKKAAKELIEKTPAAKRAKFMKRNAGNDSSVRSPTSTSSDVRSPTSTKTATHAYTSGNVTVTGGAGAGANTRVVIHKKNKGHRRRPTSKKSLQVRKRNPPKRRNPTDEAAEAYREFHGKDPETEIIVDTPVHFHSVLAGMGKLEFLDVKRDADGGVTTINFGKGVYLSENEKKTQLYIRGGDQSVNLRDFGISGPHEIEVLGEISKVGYFTEKKHLVAKDGGKAVYVHKFQSPRPMLIYDVRNRLLSVAGGGYSIPSEGIDR